MPDFMTLFQNYAKESKLSDSTLARASGFSRAYINKMRNGKKFSRNYERMMKVIECLQLEKDAEDELKMAYQMQLSDDDGYMIVDAVSQLIKSFDVIVMERDNRILLTEEKWSEQKICQGKENIMIICRKLIEQEAMREDGHIRLLMQPGQVQVQEALKWGLRNNPDLQVEQLIGLEKTAGSNHLKKKNVEMLQQLVPIILSQQKMNYRVYYHYEWMSSYLSAFRMASAFLVTGTQVLCINDDFTRAILWSEKNCVEYFASMFDDRIRRAELLYFTCEDPVDVYANFFVDASDTCPVYTMGGLPLIQRLQQFNQKMRCTYEKKSKVIAYFTKRGTQKFLETGRVEENSKTPYHPLEIEDRKLQIRNLISLAREGKYEPHLMEEEQFYRYPAGLVIDCYSENDIVVYYHTDFEEKYFIIRELSLANCFYQYMEWMRTSSRVWTVEETVAYMERMIE